MNGQSPPPEQPSDANHATGPSITVLLAVLLPVLLAVVILMAIFVVRLAGSRNATDRAETSPSTDPRPPTSVAPLERPISPTGDAVFDAGVTEVARFVEATRGHPFREQVRVDLVDDALFTQMLLADFGSGIDDIRTTEITLKALGILPPGADLVSEVQGSMQAGVIGFYDPGTTQLVIRGTDLTAFTRTTLAHELTHALDDQWFELDRPALATAGADARFGFQALVEGTASWVEEAWTESRSPTERAAATTEAREFGRNMVVGDHSVAVVQIVQSPYVLGLAFIESITTTGGTDAIDRAFATPPISSEQVIHPEKYAAGEMPIEVPSPPSDGPVITDETLGELDLTAVLSTSLAPAIARTAGEGWGGDRYVVWRSASGASCIRLDVVGDTPTDSAAITDAFRRWAAAQPRQLVPGADVMTPTTGTTRLTSCR